jgi:hypothetical protein
VAGVATTRDIAIPNEEITTRQEGKCLFSVSNTAFLNCDYVYRLPDMKVTRLPCDSAYYSWCGLAIKCDNQISKLNDDLSEKIIYSDDNEEKLE